MWHDNRLCELFEIDHPIIQAPMAGATTPEMVSSASNAGALGSHGCAMHSKDQFLADMAEIKKQTSRSVNVNFFVHKSPQNMSGDTVNEALKAWYNKFEIETIPAAVETNFPFDQEMCDAVCSVSPKVASFHFGLPDATLINQLKAEGIKILSSATSVKEALWLEENGADAIIAQGFEAGGHSGWFLPRNGADLTGTMALVPRVVDAVSVPVIAAGGIADGRGIAASLMLSAEGVQIGTAFVTTQESCANAVHKNSLLDASGDDTMYSRAFSGRLARTVVNEYANSMESVKDLPDFPIMNTITAPIKNASLMQDKPDAVALWSGQAAGLNRNTTTENLISTLVKETRDRLK